VVSAFCLGRGGCRRHQGLWTHRRFGPRFEGWRERGVIPRRGRFAARLSIAAAFGVSVALGVKPALLIVQALVLLAVSLFIWTRPEG